MKTLILFLLLIPFIGFSQAVPNAETFSLQDVYNAVSNHTPATSTNLQSCFTNAISGYFNTTYNQDSYAPANSMLRFRDYKPSCDLPIVTTASISSITGTTASGGGNVTDDGGCTVTERGVVYSRFTQTPTTADSKTSDGTGTGSFTSSLTSLICPQTFYVRAYATNSAGTAYGNTVSFVARDVDPSTLIVFTRIATVTNSGGTVLTGTSLAQVQAMCAAWATRITHSTTNLSINTIGSTGALLYTYPGQHTGCRLFASEYYLYESSGTLYIYEFSAGVVQSITQCYP